MEYLCRLCLSFSTQVVCKISEESDMLAMIRSCLSIQLKHHDGLPDNVCKHCYSNIEHFNKYKTSALRNQEKLHQHLNNGKDSLDEFFFSLNEVKIKKEQVFVADYKESEGTEDKDGDIVQAFDAPLIKDEPNDEAFDNDDDYHPEDDSKNESLVDNSDLKLDTTDIANSQSINVIRPYKPRKRKKYESTDFPAEIFKCVTCFTVLKTLEELMKHYNSEHNVKKSRILKNFYSVIKNGDEETYKCNKCNKIYTEKRNMSRHVIIHAEDRPFVCNLCARTYTDMSNLIRHGRVHNGYRMTCRYLCGYSTAYVGALNEHEKRHTSEFKYRCEHCGKGFQVKTWYDQHQNVHNNVKPYKCDLCDLAFHMERYLKAHRVSVHRAARGAGGEVRRYACAHCALPCGSVKYLRFHLKEEHNIQTESQSFLCDTCGKTLKNSHQLQFHRNMHSGAKQYQCNICNKTFTKKFNLKIHEVTHTREKAFACEECGKSYSQKSALERHRAKGHQNKGRRKRKSKKLDCMSDTQE